MNDRFRISLSLRAFKALLIASLFTGCTRHELIHESNNAINRGVFGQGKTPVWDHLGAPLNSPSVARYVDRIAGKISPFAKRKQAFNVTVTDEDIVNGSSHFVSGDITVTRGMLNAAVSEAELAGYLGHEMGHYDLKHGEREHEKGFYRQAFNRGLAEAVSRSGVPYEAKEHLDDAIATGYSRHLEQEADEYGAEIAAKAGYDPYALADLFDRLAQLIHKGATYRIAKLKGSHKALDARSAHLRKFLKRKGYARQGIVAEARYQCGLSPLLDEKAIAIHFGVNPQDVHRLAEIESEVAQYQLSGIPIPKTQFVEMMKTIETLSRAFQSRSTHAMHHFDAFAFMEEALVQPMPLWNNRAMTGPFQRVGRVLNALSGMKVAVRGGVQGTIKAFEEMVGRAWRGAKDLFDALPAQDGAGTQIQDPIPPYEGGSPIGDAIPPREGNGPLVDPIPPSEGRSPVGDTIPPKEGEGPVVDPVPPRGDEGKISTSEAHPPAENQGTSTKRPAKPGEGSRQVVLGSYPDYLKKADELNAKRFNIPTEVWKTMSPEERRLANQKFLDRAVNRNAEFILSNSPKDLDPESSFQWELNYLKSKGYVISPDGKRLVKR